MIKSAIILAVVVVLACSGVANAQNNPQGLMGDRSHLINNLQVGLNDNAIDVGFQAPPGGNAFFTIGRQRIPMFEVQTGNYRGTCNMPPGADPSTVGITAYVQLGGNWDAGRSKIGAANAGGNMSMTLSPSGGNLRTGQTLQITVVGPPGSFASYDLGAQTNLPMSEVSPGTYVANYTVQPDDSLAGAQVTSHIQMADGTIQSASSTQSISFNSSGANPYPQGGQYPGNQYPGSQPPGNQYPGNQYPGNQPPGNPYSGSQYPTGGGSAAPIIDSVSTSGPGPFYVGQIFAVMANGTPGMVASLNLGGRTIPMVETSPGAYTTTYQVQSIDNFQNTQVKVTLRSPGGQRATQAAPGAVSLVGIGANAATGNPGPGYGNNPGYGNSTGFGNSFPGTGGDVNAPGPPPIPAPGGGGVVAIDQPTMRASLAAQFEVTGRVTAGSRVRLQIYTTDSDLPGGRLLQSVIDTDEPITNDGRFQFPVSLSGGETGDRLSIMVHCLDNNGNDIGTDQVVVTLR